MWKEDVRRVLSGLKGVASTWLLMVAFLTAAVLAVYSQRASLRDAVLQLTWWALLASTAAAVLAVLSFFGSWQAALADTGALLTSRDGLRIYALAQVGKYLPGAVWPILAQAQLGRRVGVAPLRMATGSMMALAVSVCVGLALGSILLPFSSDEVAKRMAWLPVVALGMSVLLVPAVLNPVVRWIARVLRRPGEPPSSSWSGLLRSAGWCVIGNLAFGAHIMLLGYPLGVSGAEGFLVSVCAYSSAASLGVLLVFAPAGAGVREVVLVLVLTSMLSLGAALLIALVSRAILVLVDVTLAVSQLGGPSARRERVCTR